jgi:hypothetical protein
MLRRIYNKRLGRSLSYKAVGISEFFLLMLLIICVSTKVSYADTIQSEDPPVIEWQKLWKDFEAKECAYYKNLKFTKLDLKTEKEFKTEQAQSKFVLPGDLDIETMAFMSYISQIGVADTILTEDVLKSVGGSELSEYKRRDIFGFYIYKTEQDAELIFNNVVQEFSWIMEWAPVKNAPGFNELKEAFKFKKITQEKDPLNFIKGNRFVLKGEFFHKKDGKNLDIKNMTKSGVILKPGQKKKDGAMLIFVVERYKTVIMIYGFWIKLGSKSTIKDIKLSSFIKKIPPKPNLEIMAQRAKAIVDERVRFLRVELIDPNPNTEFVELDPAVPKIKVKITECMDRCYKENSEWIMVSEKDPVYVTLKMFSYGHSKTLKQTNQIDAPPNRKDLIEAYEYGSFGMLSKKREGSVGLKFDSPSIHAIHRYKTKKYGMPMEISLLGGTTFRKDKFFDKFQLNADKLATLLFESYDSRASRNYYPILGDVGATIIAEAYHISRNKEEITLARSKPGHCRYTHVAEIVDFGYQKERVKQGDEYFPEYCIYDGKKYSKKEYHAQPLKKGMKLMPNDYIPFGRLDWVRIKYLFLNQIWSLEADPDEVPEGRITFYTIEPTRIVPWSKLWQKFMEYRGTTHVIGVSGLGVSITAKITTFAATEAGQAAAAFVGELGLVLAIVAYFADFSVPHIERFMGRSNIRFINIGPPKSMFSIHVGKEKTNVYVLEGEVPFGDMLGNNFTLKQGHMSKFDSKATLSPPEKFDQASLPASVKSAVERLKKDLPPVEASLGENKVTRKQAEEDSAYAWIKIAAERGFFIFRELRKLPIIERLKTIAEKAERKQMVEKYDHRIAELGENIDQALATYADAFRQLEKIDRAAIDAGFQKYSQFLSERKATEQLTVLKTVKDHMFAYLGEKKKDNEKWRRDFAGI